MIETKSGLRQPSRTKDTAPGACGSSGSGDTVTSINFTYFHADSVLILARIWSLVPIGTAWSTGSSFSLDTDVSSSSNGDDEGPPIRAAARDSLYKETSYSRRPGVSSTMPDTRALLWLKYIEEDIEHKEFHNLTTKDR